MKTRNIMTESDLALKVRNLYRSHARNPICIFSVKTNQYQCLCIQGYTTYLIFAT